MLSDIRVGDPASGLLEVGSCAGTEDTSAGCGAALVVGLKPHLMEMLEYPQDTYNCVDLCYIWVLNRYHSCPVPSYQQLQC